MFGELWLVDNLLKYPFFCVNLRNKSAKICGKCFSSTKSFRVLESFLQIFADLRRRFSLIICIANFLSFTIKYLTSDAPLLTIHASLLTIPYLLLTTHQPILSLSPVICATWCLPCQAYMPSRNQSRRVFLCSG